MLVASILLSGALTQNGAGQEYSNGGPDNRKLGPAIQSPVEAYGVQPPGSDAQDAKRLKKKWRYPYEPYYAPVSPVATSARWQPTVYHPLAPYYTPYYPGYSPHRHFKPEPPPYGSDGWGEGPMPDPAAEFKPTYGVYTSVLRDDTIFWNMGGNGLVPYGAPPLNHPRPPDIIDTIQANRGRVCHGEMVPILTLPPEVEGKK
jgi:hypothetical protein